MTQQTVIFALTRTPTAAVGEGVFVGFDGNTVGVAGARSLGVSETAAAANFPLNINVLGTAKVRCGAAVPLLGSGLTPVKSDAAGKAIPQAGVGAINGYALQAGVGVDSTIEILLTVS